MKRTLIFITLILCLFITTVEATSVEAAPSTSSDREILEAYIAQYKNNPDLLRKDYKGLENVENPIIIEHTIHSGSIKDLVISSKAIDENTKLFVYITYVKDGQVVHDVITFEMDGKKVKISVPQSIQDMNLECFAIDIIAPSAPSGRVTREVYVGDDGGSPAQHVSPNANPVVVENH